MTKRFVSLLMALMLIIGIFAVPALAAQGDDGIEPHTKVWCMNCGALDGNQEYRWDKVDWNDRTVACTMGASGCGGDYTVRKYTGLRCSSCLYVYNSKHVDTGKFCPGFGGYYY